jgi:SAM-dependent methyltransferase
MPAMSRIEQAFCRSLPWRAFTGRVVFPWAIGDTELHGDVLELDRYPTIRLVATDVDPAMRAAAVERLVRYGDRVSVQDADATRLPFPDATFDAVISFIMLHHVIDWEQALAEIARVLRPGGIVAGYDLVESWMSRATHRLDRSAHRMASPDGLRARLDELPFKDVAVQPGLAGLVTRFRACRVPTPAAAPT